MHALDRDLDKIKEHSEATTRREFDDSTSARARLTQLSLSSFSTFTKNGLGKNSGSQIVAMM
jgi:hypothetical protein